VLPALPTIPAPRVRALSHACLLAVLVLLGAAPARCFEVTLDPPREHDGLVWVDTRLSGVFEPRVEESLSRGMPATLRFHAELWRRRRGWFGAQQTSFDAALRIRYDVRSDFYVVQRAGAAPRMVATLDSLREFMSGPMALRVGRVGELQPRASYFVLVVATLKPLSVEDVQEGERWLAGEFEDKRRSGFGTVWELPGALFDVVRNFVGFGDQRARALSPDFDLESLFPKR
jgi:hypothetical protein